MRVQSIINLTNLLSLKENLNQFANFVTKTKYKDNDTQCKICNKAVMYKKCIPCSICGHFFHGKCLDFNKLDITKIENICDFYMCPPCLQISLPAYVENEIKNTFPKLKSKQCFTCPNTVAKDKYRSKYFLYNDQKQCLCRECSKLGRDIPVRKKDLIEFIDCSVCSKEVKYESIFCNLCQHWVHPYCNKIDKLELGKLSKSVDDWHCLKCNLEMYPNDLILENTVLKNNKLNPIHDFITYDECSVCWKKVTGNETLACSYCNHWVHKQCIGYFKNRAEYQNFLHYYSTKHWDCPTCMSDILPFTLLEQEEFLMLLLDMNVQPVYLNKDNFQRIYTDLHSIDFFKTIDADEITHNRYLNEIDPDINHPTIDTCNYIIDTNNLSIKSSKELVMMTFNIRSIKKNFDNFTKLLSSITVKVHIICLTESWLGTLDNIDDFKLDGYYPPQYQNRIGNMHGGGVVTYIHRDITRQKVVKNLSFVDEFNHCLATEVIINNKAITFLNVYRSPSNLNESFIEKFESVINIAKSKMCYVLGDMNYNLINLDKHEPTNNYYNILTSCSFKPLITKPTRITDSSKTLIDHIWTNDLRNTSIHNSHILITDITDHLPCLSIVASPDILLKGTGM